MYLYKKRVFIDYDEEIIFNLINENDAYPELNWLWEKYYDSPTITPYLAKVLASELTALANSVKKKNNEKLIIKTCIKLSTFFNHAYVAGKNIKCLSD